MGKGEGVASLVDRGVGDGLTVGVDEGGGAVVGSGVGGRVGSGDGVGVVGRQNGGLQGVGDGVRPGVVGSGICAYAGAERRTKPAAARRVTTEILRTLHLNDQMGFRGTHTIQVMDPLEDDVG